MQRVQILKDSWHPNKRNRFTTFLIKFPKCLLAELNTHRQLVRNVGSCLSGDTLVSFDLPKAVSNGRKRIYTLPIAEIYRRWTRGDTKGRSIKNRLKEMYLRNVNEDTGVIQHTHIKDVMFNGKKLLFKITLENGYELKCTENHRLFTEQGWKTLKDMGLTHPYELSKVTKSGYKYSVPGGFTLHWDNDAPAIACNGHIVYPNETFEYLNKDWLLSKKHEGLTNGRIAELCNTTEDKIKHACRKQGVTGFTGVFLRGHRKRIPWNKGKAYKQKPETIQQWHDKDIWSKAVETKRQKGLVKSYYSDSTKRSELIAFVNKVRKSVLERYNYRCALTGAKTKLHLHHIDPVYRNKERAFDETNLIPLCKKVHRWLHSNNLELELLQWVDEGKDLSNFVATYEDYKVDYKQVGKLYLDQERVLKINYSPIKNVTFVGVENTYDIEVEGDFKNFIADGIVVHNSRAVPVTKMIDNVTKDPFVPIFSRNQRGMVGADNLSVEEQVAAHAIWQEALEAAVGYSERLYHMDIHKEATNRLLEPFMSVWLVLSGTQFDHFFMLRRSPNAQKSFKAIADEMYDAYMTSKPDNLGYGDWHIPFDDFFPEDASNYDKLRIAVARCARVSYQSHGNDHSTEKDFELYNQLWSDKHMSPFEHVARVVDNERDIIVDANGFDVDIRHYLPDNLQDYLFVTNNNGSKQFSWTRQYAGFYTLRSHLEDKVEIK